MTQLATNRIQLANHMRNVWYVTPEHGTPIEAILEPKFWAHVSANFRPRDRIEVDAEDGSYFAELIIMDAGKLYAKVALLRKVDLQAVAIDAGASDYAAVWAGRHAKWRVIRTKDRGVMKDGFEDRASAEQWALSHSKAMAA